MLTNQLRTWDVFNPKVLKLMGTLPREAFVPEHLRLLAYSDAALPIGCEQIMLPPSIVARALQALSIKPTDRVLQIGTGTGYITALLAQLARHVYAIEYFKTLLIETRQNLIHLGLDNISLEQGDGSKGLSSQGPYEAIFITGSISSLPLALKQQLNEGAKLFAFIGEAPSMKACVFTRHHEQQWSHEVLFETVVPRLCALTTSNSFIF